MKLLDILKSKAFWVNVLLAIASFVLLIFLSLQFLRIYTHHGESIVVPDLHGMNEAEVKKTLNKLHLKYEISDSLYTGDEKPLTILDQIPKPNSKVKRKRTLFLTINASSPPLREVPDLIEKSSLKFAKLQLEAKGFVVGEVTSKAHPDLNAVLDVRYQGKSLKKGSMLPMGTKIDLVVGNGLDNIRVKIPYLIGLTVEEAKWVLSSKQLMTGSIIYTSEVKDSSNALIYMTIPEPGNDNYVRMGEPIDLFAKTELTPEDLERYEKPEWEEDTTATNE